MTAVQNPEPKETPMPETNRRVNVTLTVATDEPASQVMTGVLHAVRNELPALAVEAASVGSLDLSEDTEPEPAVQLVVDDPGILGSGSLVGAYVDNRARANDHARRFRGVVVELPVVADHRGGVSREERDDAHERRIRDEERESTLAEFERFTVNRLRLSVEQTVRAAFVGADRAELYEEFRTRFEQRFREQVAAAIEETIDADRPGDYEAGLQRAAAIARGEDR